MRTRESRPHGPAPESFRRDNSMVLLTLDDIVVAQSVGYDLGYAEGQRFADEDRARAILHAFACEMAGVTRRLATANHGPAWADLVCGDDE